MLNIVLTSLMVLIMSDRKQGKLYYAYLKKCYLRAVRMFPVINAEHNSKIVLTMGNNLFRSLGANICSGTWAWGGKGLGIVILNFAGMKKKRHVHISVGQLYILQNIVHVLNQISYT